MHRIASNVASADFSAERRSDRVVWRPGDGTWHVLNSASGVPQPAVQWGLPGDVPVAADYDGDGKTDFAVFRRSPMAAPMSGIRKIIASAGSGATNALTAVEM